LRKK